MDFLYSSSLWCGAIALLFIIIVLSAKTSIARIRIHPGRPSQLPPRVNGIALLALLPTLLKKDLHDVLNDLYAKHGSVFMIGFFGLNVTFLIGPEVTPHFFQGLESEISHGNMVKFTVPMFGEAIGHCRDMATRIEQSRFNVEALKPSRLRSHVSPLLEEVEGYFAKWGKEGVVDLKLELEQLHMLIASRCLLGNEVRQNMFDEVQKLFRDLGNGVNFINLIYPYIPIPANRRRDRARIRLTQILSEVIEARKTSGRVEEDILQKLIDSKYKDGRSITVAEVAGLTMVTLFVGTHSSSATSTWTGACLLSHPTFLRAAIEEQTQITKKYNDRLDSNALMEMETLQNCIKEALRMHPPLPVFLRKAHKQFTVQTKEGKTYEIPQDSLVASPSIVGNNLPYIYKDPLVYDPDRFGPERQEDKVGGKFSYTTFSGGRHACTGEAFAYMQIKGVWSHLLRNFELELISPFPKTDWSKFLLEPKGNLFVRYKRIGSPQ